MSEHKLISDITKYLLVIILTLSILTLYIKLQFDETITPISESQTDTNLRPQEDEPIDNNDNPIQETPTEKPIEYGFSEMDNSIVLTLPTLSYVADTVSYSGKELVFVQSTYDLNKSSVSSNSVMVLASSESGLEPLFSSVKLLGVYESCCLVPQGLLILVYNGGKSIGYCINREFQLSKLFEYNSCSNAKIAYTDTGFLLHSTSYGKLLIGKIGFDYSLECNKEFIFQESYNVVSLYQKNDVFYVLLGSDLGGRLLKFDSDLELISSTVVDSSIDSFPAYIDSKEYLITVAEEDSATCLNFIDFEGNYYGKFVCLGGEYSGYEYIDGRVCFSTCDTTKRFYSMSGLSAIQNDEIEMLNCINVLANDYSRCVITDSDNRIMCIEKGKQSEITISENVVDVDFTSTHYVVTQAFDDRVHVCFLPIS